MLNPTLISVPLSLEAPNLPPSEVLFRQQDLGHIHMEMLKGNGERIEFWVK